MKKINFFISLFIGICSITVYSVWASSNDVSPSTNFTESTSNDSIPIEDFPDLSDDDKVIQLDDGGFLYGKATLQDGDNTIELNSETDPSAITVREAKEIIKSEKNK